MDPQPAAPIQFLTPEKQSAGAYANVLSIWHSQHEFTFDFAVTQQLRAMPDGSYVLPAEVTARVRVPPGVVFSILQAINDNLAKYEAHYGSPQPTPPAGPLFPPDESPATE